MPEADTYGGGGFGYSSYNPPCLRLILMVERGIWVFLLQPTMPEADTYGGVGDLGIPPTTHHA